MSLFKLFATKQVSSIQQAQQGTYVISTVMFPDEDYISYGSRICQITNGNTLTLRTILQRIFCQEKASQSNDINVQQQYKNKIKDEISEKESQMSDAKSEKQNVELKIEHIHNRITELKQKLVEEKNKIGQDNKMDQLKLNIGCIILFFMTIYLFVFYSSTFYSAFFKTFGADNISIGTAIFDPSAFVNAYNDGLGELILILAAPIIFMGLGFSLHFFNIQKNVHKYPKIVSIIIVTFIFDCILAYMIAEKIYVVEASMIWDQDPAPFDFGIAVVDIKFWAVIFCGFVTYIIWGIVFDMTMTAYEDLNLNRTSIEQIELKISENNDILSNQRERLNTINSNINKLEISISNLSAKLQSKIIFDPNIIKNSLTQFFQGWTTILGALGLPVEESERIYNEETNS
ncbi:MAG: hypothetical protein K2G09_07830, partial [Paramuribaculum sp.]|nr:hypothetical protein [Paramuribaculum sp.]